jgi:hypothetical protein
MIAHHSLVDRIGHKAQQGLRIASAVKGAYDVGRTIYSVGQAVAPFLTAVL